MKYNLNHLSLAVRLALSVGIFAAAGSLQAQESATSDAAAANQANLDRIAAESSAARAMKFTQQ